MTLPIRTHGPRRVPRPAHALLLALPLLARPAVARVCGDVDGDGKVTTADAIATLRAAVGLSPLDDSSRVYADVNHDGKVNTLDAQLMLAHAVGLVKALSCSPPIATSIEENSVLFRWPASGAPSARLVFTQGSSAHAEVVHDLTVQAGMDVFPLDRRVDRQIDARHSGNDFALFGGFAIGQPVHVRILVGDAKTGAFRDLGATDIPNPTRHAYDPGVLGAAEPELALDHPFPDAARAGEAVTISGRALTTFTDGTPQLGLRADAYVIPPSGFPIKVPLHSSAPYDRGAGLGPRINAGGDFALQLKIDAPGTYTIEINDYAGEAALSRPIYAQDGMPLIPDRLDLVDLVDASAPPVDLAAARSEWLDRVNRDRAAFGLGPLALDSKLTAAAQGHTDDMVAKQYFGHIGPDGSDPTARALRAGVSQTESIGENLAQGANLDQSEAELMASAVHRGNLLNAAWKHIGLGVTRDKSGLLFGAQEFGADAGEYDLPADFFNRVVLDRPLPTLFVAGRTVTVSGKVIGAGATVILFFQKVGAGTQVVFPNRPVAVNADGTFSIPVTFTAAQAGTYQIGISVDQGASTAAFVAVKAAP